MTRVWIVLVVVLACSCVKIEDTYAPPVQRRPLAGPDTSRLKHFIAMNDPAASDHFLRDIGELEAGSWRWTRQNPTLRFVLPTTKGLKFTMDFGIHGDTMKETGPVTITFSINGHTLDKVRYEKPGGQHFEKAVPAEWLGSGEDVVAQAALDKIYIASADKAQLGITLARAGFVE